MKAKWSVRVSDKSFNLVFRRREDARRYKNALKASGRNLQIQIVKIRSFGKWLYEKTK